MDIRKADVRVIFSTGTDWGLASSGGTFRPSTDTLSIVSCWLYRKYAPGYTILEGLEKEARDAKKGLWADPQPVPPWKWRKK